MINMISIRNKKQSLTAMTAAGIILSGVYNSSCTNQNSPVRNKTKPNILFLLADDQKADAMGCAGNTYIKTPNIDKLAKNGIRFTNCYVMGGNRAAICAPSRAMLMSGKYLFHVYDVLDGVNTMPMYFEQNGYETFGTGKWHNGRESFEVSFQKGENVFLGGISNHMTVPCQNMGPGRKLGDPVKKGYSTDIFTDAAMRYISDYSKGSRENPFFCYVAFTAPHGPRVPREDYKGMYRDESMPVPGNFRKIHPFKLDNQSLRDEYLVPWPRTPEMIQTTMADYYAMISHLDNRIGDLIKLLIKEGLYDNTIIVYAGDNGMAMGGHGLLAKQNIYEVATKVPFIISGPGVPANETRDAMVYLLDIFPTLSSLCNLPAPDGIDGKDITPVLIGKKKEVRHSLYTVYMNSSKAVRTNDWKLILYQQHNYQQLFDLENDPLEINNLAEVPGYQSKMDEMMRLMKEWVVLSGDTSSMTPKIVRPLEFKYETPVRIPDVNEPEYIVNKFFKGK
jgi:arylsulfatase A-like enzyme